MPGGEGSPINLLDHHHHHHRASAAATTSTSTTDECANCDDVRTTASSTTSTGATFTSAMTSALAGDGLRRRKVIHAARETLDKGESFQAPLLRPFAVPRIIIAYETSRNHSSLRIPSPRIPFDFLVHGYRDRSSFPAMPPDRRNVLRSVPGLVQQSYPRRANVCYNTDLRIN